jgi:hypothetical protein
MRPDLIDALDLHFHPRAVPTAPGDAFSLMNIRAVAPEN